MIFKIISKLKKEFSQFTLVGIANAVLTFVVFFSLFKIFKANYLLALSIAWAIGVLFSYIVNFVWVFKPESKLHFKKRFPKYFLSTLVTFILNLFLLKNIVENTHIDPFYAQLLLIPFVVLLNFLTAKFWSLQSEKNSLSSDISEKGFSFKQDGIYPIFFRYISALTITISVTLIAYSIWILNRGFEATDESYYILLAIHSSAVKLFISAQHWFLASLWSITGNIVGFRATGLAILLLSAAILAVGSINMYTFIAGAGRFKKRDMILIVSGTFLGALLYGTTINFSPCYNLLTAAAVYAAVGFVFLAISKLPSWRTNVLYLLSGSMLGVAFLNKFSAGIASLFLIFILIFILHDNMQKKIWGWSLVLLGMFLSSFLLIFFHSQNSNLLEEFKFGIAVFKQVQTEASVSRLLRYGYELATQILWSGALFIFPLAYLIFYKKFCNIMHYTIGCVLGVLLLNAFYLPIAFVTSKSLGFSASFSALLALSLIVSMTVWIKNTKLFTLAVGLIILPYCIALGTGNNISTQIVVSLASWGTFMAIMTVAISKQKYYNGLTLVIYCIFVFLVLTQFIVSSFSPYGLRGTIWGQNVPTKIADIGTIKTDQATHNFVSVLTVIGSKCDKNHDRPYLGFYGLPGVALIINATPVFSPWLTNASQSDVLFNKVRDKTLDSALVGIVLSKKGIHSQLPSKFSNFPDNYKLCGRQVTFPHSKERVQLWKPIPAK